MSKLTPEEMAEFEQLQAEMEAGEFDFADDSEKEQVALKTTEDASKVNTPTAFVKGLANAATLGFGDEIVSAAQTMMDPSISYEERQAQKEEQAQLEATYAGGAQLAGEVVGSLVPGAALLKGAQKVGLGVKTALAAEGALSGAGYTSTGATKEELLENTMVGGIVGGMLGKAGEVVTNRFTKDIIEDGVKKLPSVDKKAVIQAQNLGPNSKFKKVIEGNVYNKINNGIVDLSTEEGTRLTNNAARALSDDLVNMTKNTRTELAEGFKETLAKNGQLDDTIDLTESLAQAREGLNNILTDGNNGLTKTGRAQFKRVIDNVFDEKGNFIPVNSIDNVSYDDAIKIKNSFFSAVEDLDDAAVTPQLKNQMRASLRGIYDETVRNKVATSFAGYDEFASKYAKTFQIDDILKDNGIKKLNPKDLSRFTEMKANNNVGNKGDIYYNTFADYARQTGDDSVMQKLDVLFENGGKYGDLLAASEMAGDGLKLLQRGMGLRASAGVGAGGVVAGPVGAFIGGAAGALMNSNAATRLLLKNKSMVQVQKLKRMFKIPRNSKDANETIGLVADKIKQTKGIEAAGEFTEAADNAIRQAAQMATLQPISELLQKVMKDPAVEQEFEPGLGFDGKAITERDFIEGEAQIKSVGGNLADEFQALKYFRETGDLSTPQKLAQRKSANAFVKDIKHANRDKYGRRK